MRKSLWTAVLVIVLCVGLGVTGFVRLNESGKQVQYEETVLFGDKTAIDGMTVMHQLYDRVEGGYLYWDTAYRPGKGVAETDFTYMEKPKETPPENQEYLNIYTYSGGGVQSSGSIDLREQGGEWAPILIDVAEHAGTETRYTESVDLNDYFEYLPLQISANIGELHHLYSGSVTGGIETAQWIKDLQNAFCIPVPEKCYATVEIFKRTDGSVYHYHISMGGNLPELRCYSLVTEEYCYLLVTGKMPDGSPLSTELVTGVWGIYRIPYETVEIEQSWGSRESTILHTEEMEKISSVEPGIRLNELSYDEKNERIEIVYTNDGEGESDRLNLMVVDGTSGKTLQTLPLTENAKDVWLRWSARSFDDFKIVTLDDGAKRGFILLSRGEDGSYRKEYEAEFPAGETEHDYIWLDTGYEFGADLDGERLAMVAISEDFINPFGICRFELVIYQAGEMIFHGHYANSLGIRNGDYSGGCQPWGKTPVRVSWD